MKECWVCIVEIREDNKPERSIPKGFDAPMRGAIEKVLEINNIMYDRIESGWGFPPSQVGKLISTWTRCNIIDDQFEKDLRVGNKLRNKKE